MADSQVNETTPATPEIDAMTDRIGHAVFGPMSEPDETPGIAETEAPATPESVADTPAPVVLEPPKSWKAEMHPYWQKTDPKVQSYYLEREKQMLDGLEGYKTDAQFAKQFRDSLSPYRQTLQQLGVDELTAAKSLFQADHLLRYSPAEQKRAYFEQLAKNYGIDLGVPSQPAAPVDPVVQGLQQKLASIEQQLTAKQQAELAAARDAVNKELEAFAGDTVAHPYFDEVAEQIAIFVSAGKSLQDAYDAAVWANPVTRQKEQARVLTEHEAKLKENARLASLPKKKAAGINVHASDRGSAPTEPLGTLEDTIRSVHKQLKNAS